MRVVFAAAVIALALAAPAGGVFVRVCRSAKRSAGAICDREATGQAKRGAGGVYSFRPHAFRFTIS
jgi:hypothetical protein